MIWYFNPYGAPRAVSLLVRGRVTQTVDLAEVFDYLNIDTFEIFYLSRLIKKPAAFVRQQLQSFAATFKRLVARTNEPAVKQVFHIQVNRNNQSVVAPDGFNQIREAYPRFRIAAQGIVNSVSHDHHRSAPPRRLWSNDFIQCEL